jgi:CRP/FNR family transcriptional regulator
VTALNSSHSRSIDIAEVLHGLSADEAAAVLKMTEDRTYACGTGIFSLGDPQAGICLVKQGLVEEFRLTESGAKLPMSRIGPGKLFALSSVNGCYCCFTETVEESVIGFLSFEALEDLCRRLPKLAVNLVEVLARRLGEIEDRLELLAFSGLRSRVAWALLGLYGIHGPRLEGVTHEALASWAASSRPKVSMVLEELQQAGLLTLSRGMIELRDPAGLEEWAKQVASA